VGLLPNERNKMRPLEDAVAAIKKSSIDAQIFVGCDSVRYKKSKLWEARYDTVIVLHHPRDGCSIFAKSVVQHDFGNIRQRMLNEVGHVVEAATMIIDAIGPRYMEIHLDMNTQPQFKSNVAVSEAIGWVRGATGLNPKLKPDAWAASHVADHVVRGKVHNA
jgi:hypothetical protein